MSATLVEAVAASLDMSVWPRYPSLYEINTWVWLSDLSRRAGKKVTLDSVPAAEWDAVARYGFDAIWFMGVWERSPAGIAVANQNDGLLQDFRRALPDFRPDDNVGSPYCVRDYVVDEHLGGPGGLDVARQELSKRGMNLILDFVPNHVAPDHSWVSEHPEFFVRGSAEDLRSDPTSYCEAGGTIFACGRDPYFPAWPDVLQLNSFEPGLREAAIRTISGIAEHCDGIRCDMAMLMMNQVFEHTWSGRAGQRPKTEYWVDVITSIKKKFPGFLFIAEAYWDLEWELQQQGFDFCYDKKLYDRLENGDAESIRLHLCADMAYQSKLVRFIENHDEPRAAATFSPAKQRAIAVATATLPGVRLTHEGQFEGRKTRVPVFLGRRPHETVDHELENFYAKLLRAVDHHAFREGQWSLCERSGWPDNPSFQNVLAWTWTVDEERYLIVINLSESHVQARIQVPWAGAANGKWSLIDVLSESTYERDESEMQAHGLYVELRPWSYHFFECLRS